MSEVEIKYSNITNIEVSNLDAKFTFGLRVGSSQEIPPENVVAKIYMSLHHAKTFANVLMQSIKNYEEAFGVLNLEPNAEMLASVKEKDN